jgi:tetratricopeptide (TPR) repeat protein
MDEALAWLRVVAMKEAREPRDDIFVTTQLAEAATRAHALEQAGELFMAWREYRQTGATFDGLADTSPLQQAVANLSSQKAVRDGAKHEKQEFDEQDQVTGPISAGLSALREVSTPRVETRSQIEQNIIALRERVAHEKRPDRVRILKRALGGILVEALELGQERMEAKDLAVANDYFQLACNADPDSSWALSNLATTRAPTGDRKGTLEALRHAREKTKDLGAFSAWLKDEPAFATMREDPQFRVLLANPGRGYFPLLHAYKRSGTRFMSCTHRQNRLLLVAVLLGALAYDVSAQNSEDPLAASIEFGPTPAG